MAAGSINTASSNAASPITQALLAKLANGKKLRQPLTGASKILSFGIDGASVVYKNCA